MAKAKLPRPTDGELEILRVLWRAGPSTVREVHAALAAEREVGYTTVLKLLQIMTEKGLVDRDDAQRSHVYRARHREERMQQQLVADLLARAFGGAADKLVMQALAAGNASAAELAEIRKLLDELEDKP